MECGMFRVKGRLAESRQNHENLINHVTSKDPGAGIILAAVYFEWCVRRSIVALGKSSVAELNAKIKAERLNLEDLKSLWQKEVCVFVDGHKVSGLPDVFDMQRIKPVFGTLKLSWVDIDRARKRRNELVHGVRCAPLERTGAKYVALLLAASKVLSDICVSQNCDIFHVIPTNRRRK